MVIDVMGEPGLRAHNNICPCAFQLTAKKVYVFHFSVRHDLVADFEASGCLGDEHLLQFVLLHDTEGLLKLLPEKIECKSKRLC